MDRGIGHGARRVTHPLQQGSRLAWSDHLFEQVDRIPEPPMPEPIPVGEASDSDFGEFCACELRRALRGEGA